MVSSDFESAELGKQIFGFQTAKGSIYEYDRRLNASRRLKLSAGQGQGCWHSQSMCFFISQNAAALLTEQCHYILSRYSYRVGMVGKTGFERHKGDFMIIPEGQRPGLGIFDRKTGQYALRWVLSDEGPRQGLVPLETSLIEGADGRAVRTTHMGNAISHLFRSREALKAKFLDAKDINQPYVAHDDLHSSVPNPNCIY